MPVSTGPVKEPNLPDQQLVGLGQILQLLREADDPKVLIETTLTYLKRNFAADYGLIWLGLYDRLDHRLVGKGGTLPQGSAEMLKQRFSLSSGELMEQVVMQHRPVAVADLRQEVRAGEWQRLAERQGIQGTMMFPLVHRDRTLGVVILGSKQWGIFPSTQEKAYLTIVLSEVAALLERVERDWQRQQVKRPDKPLMQLMDRMRSLNFLGQRLEAVIEETHRFIGSTRSSIYWFEPKQRYFWRRISNQSKTTVLLDNTSANSGITAQEVGPFYQTLLNDQLVSISPEQTSLRSDAAQKLLQLLKARSVLVAPIIYQRELIGFLSVEDSGKRTWEEEERQYLRTAAQMIALASPLEDMEAVVQQTQLDHALITEISQSLYSKNDWRQTVTKSADLLGKRLKIDRLVVVLHNKETQCFDLCYQSHARQRRPLGAQLPALSALDWRTLASSPTPIGIENWEEDLRLGTWRKALMEMGCRSIMACSTAPGQELEGILLICNDTPRSWVTAESSLFQIAAQQLGLILHQWQLQRQQEQNQSLQTALRACVLRMQHLNQPEELDRFGLAAAAQVTESPMVALLSWFPGDLEARLLVPSNFADKRFLPALNTPIDLYQDPLVQQILAQTKPLRLNATDIPATSDWFRFAANTVGGSLLAATLRTSNDEVLGILLVADVADRHWSERHHLALETIVNQLAWCRRSLRLSTHLEAQRRNLSQLSWYKQRQLEEVHRTVNSGIQKLLQIKNKPGQEALTVTRQQQILHQINDAVTPLEDMITNEFWQLEFKQEPASLIGLLRRTLERVDPVIKERQLWSQVHNEDNPMITGDTSKLELILYEILLSACLRSEGGSRVDIWCRQFDAQWVEIAITDTGEVSDYLIEALKGEVAWDQLAPSPIDTGVGLHLQICKNLAEQMGAQFTLAALEDHRVMSRLMLPTAVNYSV
jgi:GAF domain-containing protein